MGRRTLSIGTPSAWGNLISAPTRGIYRIIDVTSESPRPNNFIPNVSYGMVSKSHIELKTNTMKLILRRIIEALKK